MTQRRPKGDGNIRVHKSGLIEARWVPPRAKGEKPRSISVYGKSRQEAVAKRTARKAAELAKMPGARRGNGPAGSYLVGEALQDWLDSTLPGKRTVGRRSGIKSETWQEYEGIVRIHLAPLSNIPVEELTTRDINELIKGMKGAPRTVEKHWQVLGTALNWLVETGAITKNPAKPASPPAVPRRSFSPISADQVKTIMEVISGHPLEALFYLALTTGARQGELLALQWSDFDPPSKENPHGTVTIERTLKWTKLGPRFDTLKTESSGAASRTIGLTPRALRHLTTLLMNRSFAGSSDETREARVRAFAAAVDVSLPTARRQNQALERRVAVKEAGEVGDLVFVTAKGEPIRAKGHYGPLGQWKALQKKHGLPVRTFHDMRHVAASMMVMATNGDMFTVSKILGHSDTRMIQRTYGHLVDFGSKTVRAYAALLDE